MLLATCKQKAVTTDFVLCRALCYFRATKVDERKTLKRNQVVNLMLRTAEGCYVEKQNDYSIVQLSILRVFSVLCFAHTKFLLNICLFTSSACHFFCLVGEKKAKLLRYVINKCSICIRF